MMGKTSYQETFGPIPVDVPPVDLVTFTFDYQRGYDKTKKLYFDAADDSKALSAAEVETNVKKLVAGFKEIGVKKGDVVILHLFNTYVYTCLFLGAIGCGAAFTGTNPSYTVWELSHRFKLCKPAVIITAPEHVQNVQAACKESGDTDTKIFVLDSAAYDALCGSSSPPAIVTSSPPVAVKKQTAKSQIVALAQQIAELESPNEIAAFVMGMKYHLETENRNLHTEVASMERRIAELSTEAGKSKHMLNGHSHHGAKQNGHLQNGTTHNGVNGGKQNGAMSNGNAVNGSHEKAEAVPSVAQLLSHGSRDWDRITDIKTAKETIACMFSTSGTTGLPKVSQISHYGTIAQNPAIRSEGKNYEVRGLMSLPFFNLFASGLVHVDPLRWGTPMYVMSRFDIKKYVESIHKYRITDTATAPLMLIYLLKSGLPLKEKLASLRYIWNGSAPIDSATLTEFQSKLSPKAMIAAIWGMSETGCQTAFKWFEQDVSGSVGRIVPGVEMKLLDENGQQIVEDNIHGEAWVRSHQLMTSYVKNPVATDEMIKGDWLRTGDVCYVSEGKWFVVDRKKELIKVRGWQVAPAELEGVLVSHPKILDAAVVGVPFEDSEAPRAFVLRAPGATLNENDVREFMAEKLAKFKSLTGGIVFVDEIPKNMTGKTVKKKLKDKYPYTNGVTV